MNWTWQYLVKALYAGLITFLGGLQAALLAVPETGIGDIATAAWVGIILLSLLAFGGILGLQSAPASVATGVK